MRDRIIGALDPRLSS